MLNRFPIVVLLAALLAIATRAPAQQQEQPPVPDAPQPQKKAAAKPAPAAPPAEPAPPAKPAADNDTNAFPEAVSRDAAAQAAQQDNPPPSPAPAHGPAATTPPAGDNPFPEAVSRDAAKAAAKADGNDDATPVIPRSDLPPGVSSSQSQGAPTDSDNGPAVADPARAKKDTDVAGFYLKTGNYQGALLRFQDASKADPTNVAAIFGLAQAQQSLGKPDEAAKNYQLYLDIVPNGPRAKEAMKALKTLASKQ